MDKIRIVGSNKPLKGKILISGAKNAALPLMTACLLTDETLTLTNIAHLSDVWTLCDLLESLGVDVTRPPKILPAEEKDSVGRTLHLSAQRITNDMAHYDLVRKMRASVLVLGPLLARHHKARVSLPGGCSIGPRPVDLHIKGLEALGAEITMDEGYINAKAPGGLKGANITMPVVSVGATENLLMAATLAKGTTKIINAAQEPEISDLANCLNAMGADISGIGTSVLVIQGKERLHGATHKVLADRIEAGTYAIAAAITGGELELINASLDTMPSFSDALVQAGCELIQTENSLIVKGSRGRPRPVDVKTEPFPGFATDLQAQFMAYMTIADGASMINETIFENRLMHVSELARMGANISINGRTALVRGVEKLHGAEVMATDLRASVSLILAGLIAEGETIVNRVYHLDRGYENIELKLAPVGAKIERLRGTESESVAEASLA